MAADTKTDTNPSPEQISVRAYQIYLERGRQNGHDVDDWLQAEYELRKLPVRVLANLKPPKPRRGEPQGKSLVQVVRLAMVGLGF